MLVVVMLTSLVRPASAAEVPAELRAAIFLRSLAYDRAFTRKKGSAVFAVLVPTSGRAKKDATKMLAAFKKHKTATVGKRHVRVVSIEHVDSASTIAKLKAARAEIVYVPNGMENDARALVTSRLLLLCGTSRGVSKGCHLGLEIYKGRPRLVVDLPGTRKAGHVFDVRLLRLARVIR